MAALSVILAAVALLFLVPPALVLASRKVSVRAMPLWFLVSFGLSWLGYVLFLIHANRPAGARRAGVDGLGSTG